MYKKEEENVHFAELMISSRYTTHNPVPLLMMTDDPSPRRPWFAWRSGGTPLREFFQFAGAQPCLPTVLVEL
jgi:hypothetical protein